ncbi:MAG: hypothetical protein ABI765_03340 [Gemmatimonadota bacterium]
MTASLPDDLMARLRRLPPAEQQRALAYVRTLERAVAPPILLQAAGSIPPEELTAMAAAIEPDCERIDAAGWSVPARHEYPDCLAGRRATRNERGGRLGSHLGAGHRRIVHLPSDCT